MINLINDYLLVTSNQVAQSCEWYTKYTHDNNQYRDDPTLLLIYFAKNVEPLVLRHVNRTLNGFPIAQHGGPLFLKLLLSEISVTNDATRTNIIALIKSYDIKTQHPGENIKDVVDKLHPIVETLNAICDKHLPDKFVDDLTNIFTTTSFDNFNKLFQTLRQNVTATRILNKLNSSWRVGAGSDAGLVFNVKNTLLGCEYVLEYAVFCYQDCSNDQTWVNIPKESAHVNSSTKVNPVPSTKGYTNDCFNCLGVKDRTNIKHPVCKCPFPLDEERIRLNKEDFLAKKKKDKEKRNITTPAPPTQPTTHKGPRSVPHKWRPPEDNKQMRRVIDSVPMSRNPKTNWWDKVVTPDSVIPPSINVTPPPSITLTSAASTLPSTASYVPPAPPLDLSESHEERQLCLWSNLVIMKKEYDAGR